MISDNLEIVRLDTESDFSNPFNLETFRESSVGNKNEETKDFILIDELALTKKEKNLIEETI